jgi:hypothetical protein
VTNRIDLLPSGDLRTAGAKRHRDLVQAFTADAGGVANLTEGKRQLIKMAASLGFAIETVQTQVVQLVASDSAVAGAGLTVRDVLDEAPKILHSIARIRGGGGPREMAALPPDELHRIADLLTRAGDAAAKSIAAGSVVAEKLELLGQLSGKFVRVLSMLGIERTARDVSQALDSTLASIAADQAAYERAYAADDADDEMNAPVAAAEPPEGDAS